MILLSGLEPDKHLFPKKLAQMHIFSCSTSKISLCLCKHQDQKKKNEDYSRHVGFFLFSIVPGNVQIVFPLTLSIYVDLCCFSSLHQL